MKLELDFRDFERAARDLGTMADQIPFALANAMSTAAFRTKESLVTETWPQHVHVRNQNFLKRALRIKKARKNDLSIAIYDDLGRVNLLALAEGGTKNPRGANLAIPSAAIDARRTGRGVPQSLRPLMLPNSFKKGDVIYQRVGRYAKATKAATKKAKGAGTRAKGKDGRGLKLAYVLKPSVQISAQVPFDRDFEQVFVAETRRLFPAAMRRAMATRRSK